MKKNALKIKRNALCPCGSGLKYKNCCMSNPERLMVHKLRKLKIRLKTPEQIAGMRKSGALVKTTLDLVEANIGAGISTNEINEWVHQFTIKNGGKPAPLNYRGFPKSVCTSVNDVVCHGIPNDRKLEKGDIINVDVTTILDGFYADSSRTFLIGRPSPEARHTVGVSRKCLYLGLQEVRPGNTFGMIGRVIQTYAESEGCAVVRDYCGHGVGLDFHEAPTVTHFENNDEFHDLEFVPGMTFTIEPMINFGSNWRVRVLNDGWTAVTVDGAISAQFEHTVLVTESGVEIIV
ncbi:type I methionyl aminopeptidase [candidate division KSB1 bacterium]|nr:type I methionyl aminopeptidase [candidate division KSB1 bacterium]